MTSIIYLLLSLFLLLFLKAKKIFPKHNYRRIPGPWTLPIIGSLHHFIGSGLPHHALRNLSQRHGHLMFLQVGERPTVVISSREGARIIIKTCESTFCDRPTSPTTKIFTYGGKDLVLSPYGDYWREIRKIITSGFLSPKRVQSFRSIREEEISDLIQLISSMSSRMHTINLSDMMSVMANNVSVRAISGSKSKHKILFVNELQRSAELAAGFCLANLFPSFGILSMISKQVRKAEKCHTAIDQLLENLIQDRRESEDDKDADDLLSLLLRHLDEHPNNSISMDTAKTILFSAVGGGTHTTGAVLEWVMSELVKNPTVMKKAQDEVRQLQGRKIITEVDLAELNFLRLVIKETLRLHPVAPLIPRVCPDTLNILNHEVPKGTTLIVNMWAVGRDPTNWKDPEEFRPERFAEGNDHYLDSIAMDLEFFPFGAGRRNCPGKFFGSAIVELTVANLLYHFNWELPCGLKPEQLDMTENFGISIRRKSSLLLHALPHTSR
ncbi:cytochrome P450 family 71 polypeptide [Rhynchospora pubera]|uniref:Cytochrome P450 family 71 polypeptide n=1 Tax=Rhynchospora pubera TaxID=906938 RepID=A0AAV8FYC4_9POAL|nr:cytochrome P450 family 71 polypeptide [Rhynchospora pubera]